MLAAPGCGVLSPANLAQKASDRRTLAIEDPSTTQIESLADAAGQRRWGREVLGGILLAGAATGMAVAGRPTLGRAVAALGHLDWVWMPLALIAEGSSLAGFARAQRRLLRVGGLDLHLIAVTAVTYAGNALSLSLPALGAEAGAVFSFRQFRRRGAPPAMAAWALAMSGLISSFTFALVLAGGAIAARSAAAGELGLAGAAVMLTAVACSLLARRYRRARELISWAATWVVRGLSRLRRRPMTHPGQAVESFRAGRTSAMPRRCQRAVPGVPRRRR